MRGTAVRIGFRNSINGLETCNVADALTLNPSVLRAESRKEIPSAPFDYENTLTTSGLPSTLATAIAAKPSTASFQTRQARLVVLPRERHADVRLSAYRSDEDPGAHGPGTYTAFISQGQPLPESY